MKQFRAAYPKALQSLLLCLFFLAACFGARAQEFADVDPASLDLALEQGEVSQQPVSITINPFCIRPIDIDVVASDPAALLVNQSGVITNGCGGDVSTFDVAITGTGAAQSYDLQFVNNDGGGVIASIPVTIAAPASCTLELTLARQRGALEFGFTIGTLEPARLHLYLAGHNGIASPLKAPVELPVLDPPLAIKSAIPSFPDLGNVGVLATITTAEDGITCSTWQTIDTGPAP